ncbi:Sec63 Brl domain-containing protein [Vararia minispora EC-137]|uniref:Sec63 Brl domain-containing protein n=1 Tax=Vararia minispora EC-137 TaxID=1314806 RepID=A0ACB8QDC4_9AGAM|nr:Sec63 Brl domain-containing protein [Vararia minispora EC-137]
MAAYEYDQTGVLGYYFSLTFLFIFLVPFTLSLFNSTPQSTCTTTACECGPCTQQRKTNELRERRPWYKPRSRRAMWVIIGWIVFGVLAYTVSNIRLDNKVYDPFEILGISSGISEKDIKSHYKKLSKKFHPDKVKLAVNQTMEEVSAYFVELTKAYKALTDETIRKNYQEYGHPDGRQEVMMGIALPAWIVSAQNNVWVLAAYGIVFGGALPALVYNWWFGSRSKTKDGIDNDTAKAFFLAMTETTEMTDVVCALAQAREWLRLDSKKSPAAEELKTLELLIEERLGDKWREVRKTTKDHETGQLHALVLLYAYLLRLSIKDASLQALQARVLLHTPSFLNAYLNISAARGWLAPVFSAIHLQTYLAQAVLPDTAHAKYAQLPGIDQESLQEVVLHAKDITEVAKTFESKGDVRGDDIKKAASRWGRLELVDASFRVIGERIVTPSALIHLVIKLRISPPASTDHTNGAAKRDEASEAPFTKQDEAFLTDPKDAEDLPENAISLSAAHAPHWPSNRKPSWWIILADMRMNHAVIPPMRITDVPFSDPSRPRNFRTYKMKFNGPQGTGVFPWRLVVLSDTFIGEDVSRDITLKVEDVSALGVDAQGAEDDISDPEEDSLAGQMAAMRGGPVKRRPVDESDDESTTDDGDKDKDSSSDSDSD